MAAKALPVKKETMKTAADIRNNTVAMSQTIDASHRRMSVDDLSEMTKFMLAQLGEIAAQLAERQPKILKLTNAINGAAGAPGDPILVFSSAIISIHKYGKDSYQVNTVLGGFSVKETPEQIIAMMGVEVAEKA